MVKGIVSSAISDSINFNFFLLQWEMNRTLNLVSTEKH